MSNNSAKRLSSDPTLLVSRTQPTLETGDPLTQQRYRRASAHRDGEVVCGRVELTVRVDTRLGLAPRERRCLTVRFLEHLDPALRADLAKLVRRRGAVARRAAERMQPVEIIVADPSLSRGGSSAPSSRHSATPRPARHRVRPARACAMTNQATDRLSSDEIMALKFAAHRQLTRWSQKPHLSPQQRAQRAALARAARTLANQDFVHGCALRASGEHDDV